MRIPERREHIRVDDWLCFEYQLLGPGDTLHASEEIVLNPRNTRQQEMARYLDGINRELAGLSSQLKARDPLLAQYLDMLNTKLDYLATHTTGHMPMREQHVNLSLGGMAFICKEALSPQTRLKLTLYTRPHGTPLTLEAHVAWCEPHRLGHWRVAVKFTPLTREQEAVLSLTLLHAHGTTPVE
ncbi:type IV pilus assembly PilZ [Legionella geestiana]|uniref:Type IV pilus assembly PilZ n=2 Tax=Legionella geestiana TaxID=45065 RepID=A0A0W0U533_9GAMM|nr:type IV pilus assembly PilZ [Legionella geestiana]STX53624.1 type IV pilus assembly PilZ [Legionella geestiana]